jgi:hypothetical protein
MPISRRDLLKHGSVAATWMAALQSAHALVPPASKPQPHPAPGEIDSVAYWNQFFSPPQASRGGGATRGGNKNQQPKLGTQVQFVHLGPNGLRYVQDIPQEDLAPVSGDVVLSVSPGQFRFGKPPAGLTKVDDFLHSAQLRIDLHQTRPMLAVLPLLAWSSLAAIFPQKSAALPTIQQLSFKSATGDSAVDKVVMPGGMGQIAVNLSAAKKPSALFTVLQDVSKVASMLNPVVGLPAISLSALQAFTSLVAQLEQHTTFLLSSVPTHVAVTQDAWNSDDRPAQAIPLPPGDYLLYPSEQAELIKPDFPNLTIEGGYLVHRDADKSSPVKNRADEAVKGLTYVTLHLSAIDAASVKTPGTAPKPPASAAAKPKPAAKKP